MSFVDCLGWPIRCARGKRCRSAVRCGRSRVGPCLERTTPGASARLAFAQWLLGDPCRPTPLRGCAGISILPSRQHRSRPRRGQANHHSTHCSIEPVSVASTNSRDESVALPASGGCLPSDRGDARTRVHLSPGIFAVIGRLLGVLCSSLQGSSESARDHAARLRVLVVWSTRPTHEDHPSLGSPA